MAFDLITRAWQSIWSAETSIEKTKREERVQCIMRDLEGFRNDLSNMRTAFQDGGSIDVEKLQSFRISTPEEKIPYPTGKNVVTYRLPDCMGAMVFRNVCVAVPGEIGSFGWHVHPDGNESVYHLTGGGKTGKRDLAPFSFSHFPAGKLHNYDMDPGAEILVIIEPVN